MVENRNSPQRPTATALPVGRCEIATAPIATPVGRQLGRCRSSVLETGADVEKLGRCDSANGKRKLTDNRGYKTIRGKDRPADRHPSPQLPGRQLPGQTDCPPDRLHDPRDGRLQMPSKAATDSSSARQTIQAREIRHPGGGQYGPQYLKTAEV